ncbi:MAG: PKD domain-containing protein [Chitinophagaceae bacterium]|nr:PKD domain-containing protein [Chitinophagaceae bacterium]
MFKTLSIALLFLLSFYTSNTSAQVTWSVLASGTQHTLAIKSDGSLWAWGLNNFGQLGDGTSANKNTPQQIGNAYNWLSVSAGYYFSIGLKTDGTIWAWGRNDYGQLGNGTNTNSNVPIQVGSASNWAKLAAGSFHSLAIKTDGTLWAWGANNHGQLGNGTTTNSNVPIQIGTATNWQSVSGGYQHTMAIKTNGTLWAFGRNEYKSLGNGSTAGSTTPIQIGISTNWQKVIASGWHTMAIKTDGTLWGWGYNSFGQLGNGTTTNIDNPTQIGSATNWIDVSGDNFKIGLQSNGTLWAWGQNNYGQYGNGTTIASTSPIQIGSLTDWTSIYAGGEFSNGIRDNSSFICSAGRNDQFQLGDGTGTAKSSFVCKKSHISSNNDLSNLTISSGSLTPGFVLATTAYSVNVTSSTNTVTVTPTAADTYATLQIRVNNGTYVNINSGAASSALALNFGANPIDIKVTAENGTTKTYTITVTRSNYTAVTDNGFWDQSSTWDGNQIPPSNADVVINANITLAASAGVINVNNFTINTGKTLTQTSNATLNINGTSTYIGTAKMIVPTNGAVRQQVSSNPVVFPVAPDGSSTSVPLTISNSGVTTNYTVNTIVSAPAGGTVSPFTASRTIQRQWNITPSAAPGSATLSFQYNNGDLPVGTSNTTKKVLLHYTGGQWTTVTGVTSTPSGSGPFTVTFNYTGSFSPFSFGDDPATNADLDNLTISPGSLSPAFAVGTYSYSACISNALTSINVTPTVAAGYGGTVAYQLNGTGGYIPMTSGAANSISLASGTNTIDVRVTSQDASNTNNYIITLNRTPEASISYSTPFCKDVTSATVTQTGQGGGTYSSTTGLSINSTSGEINPSTSTVGTYTVTYSFTNGTCSNTATTSVTVNPLPTITHSVAAADVCYNASAQTTTLAYSATTETPTTYSITWDPSPANSFVTVTDAVLGASPITLNIPAATDAGIYTGNLTVKNANGCESSTSTTFTIEVKAQPTASTTPSGTQQVCADQSYTLVSGEATTTNGTILWTVNGATNLPLNVIVPAGGSSCTGLNGTYTYIGTNVNGAPQYNLNGSATPNLFIYWTGTKWALTYSTAPAGPGTPGIPHYWQNSSGTISSFPLTGWVHEYSVCSPTSVTMTSSGSLGGSITAGATTLTPTYTPTALDAGTTVTLTMTVSNAPCTAATATYTINVKPVPVGSATAQSICSGTATNVALNSTVPVTTFTWTAAQISGVASSITGFSDCTSGCGTTIAQTLTSSSNTLGVVRYTVTPTSPDGCQGASFTVDVTVVPEPNAVATPAAQSICSGDAITPIALTGNVVGTVYNWIRNTQPEITGSIATSGSGNISGTFSNSATNALVVTFSVTPVYTSGSTVCTGPTIPATVTVKPRPTITSTNTPVVICTAGTANLTATSSLSGSTFSWYTVPTGGTAIPGATAATYSPSVSSNTTYYVAVTNDGCTSTARTAIVAAVGGIYTAEPSKCVTGGSTPFTFYMGCPDVGATYKWNFGDGSAVVTTTSTAAQTHNYTQAGNFQVTLIKTLNGIDTYYTLTVSVNPIPVVNFNTTLNTGNGSSYTFTSTSTISSGNMNYAWTFGANSTPPSSIVNSPQVTYSVGGNKNVTLTVTSDAGCSSAITIPVNVTITSGASTPNPAFTTASNTTQCITGNTFTFDRPSGDPVGTTYLWTFGDGGTSTSSNLSVTKTYAAHGVYLVQLKATFNGIDYYSSKSVTVGPLPSASFNTTNNGNGSYTFSSSSTIAQGNITTYAWSDDKVTPGTFVQFGTGSSIQRTFATSGSYNIRLTVTTDAGCTATSTIATSIIGGSGGPATSNPTPFFTVSPTQQPLNTSGGTTPNNVFTFTNASTDATSGVSTYTINYGDGGGFVSFANPGSTTHTYNTPGTYTVVVKSFLDAVEKTQYQTQVIVHPMPVASFTSSNTGLTYNFTSTSTVSTGSIASYLWTINGVTFTTASPQYTFPSAGTYTVSLQVTTDAGAVNTFTNNAFTVSSGSGGSGSLTSSFTVNGTDKCDYAVTIGIPYTEVKHSFTFTNTSTGTGGTVYTWYFGDGTSTTGAGPHTKSYALPGYYNVQLKATTNGNDVWSSQQVIVRYNPVADFNYSNNGFNYNFFSTSSLTEGSMSYAWTFANTATSTSTVQHPQVTLPAGNTNATLVVTSQWGCINRVEKTTAINVTGTGGSGGTGGSSSSFTVDATDKCDYIVTTNNTNPNPYTEVKHSFTFTNTSTGTGGTVYTWYFGDGTSTTGAGPHTKSYALPGYYNVQLKATTNGNDVWSNQQVIVRHNPVSSFTYSNTGFNYNFYSTSTLTEGSMSYAWSFVNTASSTSTVQHPQVTLPSGNTDATLIVTSQWGCINRTRNTTSINVTGTGGVSTTPNPSFTVNTSQQCLASNNYVFTNTGTYPLSGVTYLWTFGDGNTSTSFSPSHVYTTAGYYNVVLKATHNGQDYYSNQQVIVKPTPVAGFTYTVSGSLFSFTSTSTLSQGSLSYDWTFKNNVGATIGASTNQNPQFTFPVSPNFYTATLLVTSDGNCTSTTTQTIYNTGAAAGFLVNNATQCLTGNSFVLTNTSAVGSGVTYSWSSTPAGGTFSSTTAQNPTLTYASAGTYTVNLTVDNNGVITSTSYTNNITVNPSPTADYSFSVGTGGTTSEDVTFTNLSTGAGATYAWTEGATTHSTDPNPVINLTYGTHQITLTTTLATGPCTATVTKTVTVGTAPIAVIGVNATSQCSSQAFTFNSSSSTIGSGAVTYAWNFGDGTTDNTATPPAKTYANAGTYTVTLTITNGVGSHTATQLITVLASPTVGFDIYNNNPSVGNNYLFNSTSSFPSGNMTYAWTTTGGSPASGSGSNINVTYATAGVYTATLVVTGSNGCSSAPLAKTVQYCPKITADFTSNSTANQCLLGNSYAFTSAITENTGGSGTVTYAWDFGGTGTGANNVANPTWSYANAGYYNATLTATLTTAAIGTCPTTVNSTVIKYGVANITITPTITGSTGATRCGDGTVVLTATASSGTLNWYNVSSGGSSLGTGNSFTTPSLTTGTTSFWVATTENGCTSARTQVDAIVNAAPAAITISPANTTRCSNDAATLLTANVAAIWSPTAGLYTDALATIPYTGTSVATVYAKPSSSTTYTASNTSGGCTTTSNNAVMTVNASPVAYYELYLNTNLTPTGPSNPLVRCFDANDDYSFRSLSTVASGNITLAWSFSPGNTNITFRDGHAGNYVQPRILYTAAGNYDVILTVTSDQGCQSTYNTPITLNNPPVVSFTTNVNYSNPDIYANPPVTVDASATTGATSYAWSTTGTATPTLVGQNTATPTAFTYATGGTKNITLTATSAPGCTTTVTNPVTITITPKAVISIRKTTAQQPNPFTGSIGSTPYSYFRITGFSNPANPSSVVTGSVLQANSTLKVEYSTDGGTNYTQYALVNGADVQFAIETAIETTYIFRVTLTVTSDLGVSDVSIATFSPDGTTPTTIPVNPGYTYTGSVTNYRGVNNNTSIPVVNLPSIDPRFISQKVLLYPNPTNNHVKVEVAVPEYTNSVTVKVFDMNGRLIQQQRQDVPMNRNNSVIIPMNVTNISSGTYTVVVADDKGRIIGNTKMVKAIQ